MPNFQNGMELAKNWWTPSSYDENYISDRQIFIQGLISNVVIFEKIFDNT